MAGGETFNLAEACAAVDFNEARLEKRFRRTMETLARQPEKSVYGSSANRAKAIPYAGQRKIRQERNTGRP
jgi:hypothetical protein